MPISNPFVSTVDIQDSQGDVRIEMLDDEPIIGQRFRPLRIPGQMAGYYDAVFDTVSLYVVNVNGEEWLRVT